jgi:hypothetical protein
MKKGDTGSLVPVARLPLSFHVVDKLRHALTDVLACMFALLPFVCVDMPLELS